MYNDMKISVIIPTFEAENYISNCIRRLQNQILKPYEIIIIDSFSTDDTVKIAEKAGCKVEVINKSLYGHGRTRNLGYQLAKGDLLVFMVQDAIPADIYFLEELTRPIREGWAVASYARQIPYSNATPLEVFARVFNYPNKSHVKTIEDISRLKIKTFFFSNVASSVSRDAFISIGGFSDHVIVNEDMLLCAKLLQAGHTVAYQAEARVYHSHNYTLKQLFKRYVDIGIFMAQAERYIQGTKVYTEGIRFAVMQMEYLFRQGKIDWIPRCTIECALKYFAYQTGIHSQSLPINFNQK